MVELKRKPRKTESKLPTDNVRERDEKGRFKPKSALGMLNEKLNPNKKDDNLPSLKTSEKLQHLADIISPEILTSLLATESNLEDQIPLIVWSLRKLDDHLKENNQLSKQNNNTLIEKQNRLVDIGNKSTQLNELNNKLN